MALAAGAYPALPCKRLRRGLYGLGSLHGDVKPIGAGHIDFDAFFQYIHRIGYDGSFTVEATAFNAEGVVDTEMLNGCFARIRAGLNR